MHSVCGLNPILYFYIKSETINSITSDLHIEDFDEKEEKEELSGESILQKDDIRYEYAINGMEALILACAGAGIKIERPKFLQAIEAINNNIYR